MHVRPYIPSNEWHGTGCGLHERRNWHIFAKHDENGFVIEVQLRLLVLQTTRSMLLRLVLLAPLRRSIFSVLDKMVLKASIERKNAWRRLRALQGIKLSDGAAHSFVRWFWTHGGCCGCFRVHDQGWRRE